MQFSTNTNPILHTLLRCWLAVSKSKAAKVFILQSYLEENVLFKYRYFFSTNSTILFTNSFLFIVLITSKACLLEKSENLISFEKKSQYPFVKLPNVNPLVSLTICNKVPLYSNLIMIFVLELLFSLCVTLVIALRSGLSFILAPISTKAFSNSFIKSATVCHFTCLKMSLHFSVKNCSFSCNTQALSMFFEIII